MMDPATITALVVGLEPPVRSLIVAIIHAVKDDEDTREKIEAILSNKAAGMAGWQASKNAGPKKKKKEKKQ